MPSAKSLSPCPDSPNCVSSQSSKAEQYVEPLKYSRTAAEAKAKLLSLFESQPRTQIVSVEDDYVHVEIASLIFRFVDDMECVFDDERKLIHIRSASRTGYWDLGANRKRVESIRKLFGQ